MPASEAGGADPEGPEAPRFLGAYGYRIGTGPVERAPSPVEVQVPGVPAADGPIEGSSIRFDAHERSFARAFPGGSSVPGEIPEVVKPCAPRVVVAPRAAVAWPVGRARLAPGHPPSSIF